MRAAFPLTVPILAGFVFLGITCGIYAGSLGLPWWVPVLMSIVIFAGSAEFVVASQLAGAFDPLTTFAVVLIINARHLFYGLSMLERFRGLGRKRPYLIFGMCDETFSINYATEPPEGIDRGWFMTWVTALNQFYWVAGCTLGGLFGTLVATTVDGVSFAMTALQMLITIGAAGAATVLTRAAAFIAFPAGRETPAFVRYLDNALPGAVFGLLVVYCLKDVSILSESHGIPEAVGVLIAGGLYLKRHNMLLSIVASTVVYMLLVNLAF